VKFLKKKWGKLPIGLIVTALLVCLLAGSAFATNGYKFWEGEAEVTVVECMVVENLGEDDGDFDGDYVWEVSMNPGETKHLFVRIANNSDASLTVNLSATGGGPLASSWTPSSQDIPGHEYRDFTLAVTAPGNIVPDDYTVTLVITRQ